MSPARPMDAPSRRDVLRLAGLGIAAAAIPASSAFAPAAASTATGRLTLTAAPGTAPIAAPEHPQSKVWAYNRTVPGPVLRVRQGATVRVSFRNALPQPSTVHWHGIRIANAMDGVAGLTQPAVAPGGTFEYAFTAPDAGTFWYHPHNRSWEQMARGLYGVLIVDEKEPPAVDRELVMVIDDWRLDRAGEIDEASFGDMRDASHAGRLGNWITMNGRSQPAFAVAKGERLRLRLVNAANSRIIGLGFTGHAPVIVALDGQPVAPHPATDGIVVLAPAQRADIILDMALDPGSRSAIRALSGRGEAEAGWLAYDPVRVRRESPLDAPVRLAANPLPQPLDLAHALDADLVMTGGAMGRMASAMFRGRRLGIRELVQNNMAWAFNGVAGMTDTPLLDAPRRRTVTIAMVNDTAWPHAMHLHGHHFRAVERNGKRVAGEPWRDTILLQRGDKARIAFVADNPGKWLFHCHMLEHQAAGMVTWLRVGG